MFDWNGDEEVRDTIWGAFNGTEDHIVPYHKESEYNTLLTFGDHRKKQRYEQTSTDLSTTDQRKSEAKNDFSHSNLESNSHFNTNEELSAPRFDMDPWPDLPSLNSVLTNGYIARNHQDTMTSKLIDDLAKAPNLDPATDNMVTEFCHAGGVLHNKDTYLKVACGFSTAATMQLDGEPDIFGNERGDKDGNSFLDCDWDNIADFDDLDGIFRNNDSIFGHEMICNANKLLPPSTEVISTTTPSFLIPDIPLCREGLAEKGSASFKLEEQSGEGKPLEDDKTADNTVAAGEQRGCQSQLTSENCVIHDHFSNKVDRQKKLLKARKKMEGKSKRKSPQNLSSSCPHGFHRVQQFESLKMQAPVQSSSQSNPYGALCQQREVEGPGYMGFFHSSNQHMITAYGYPTQPFPTMPLMSPVHAGRRQQPVAAASHTVYSESSKHISSVLNLPEVQSRPLTMTPQEKIDKLRRRQQMQAMFAIQQQQQQFDQQSTCTDMSVPQTCSQMNQSQDAAASVNIDEATKWLSSSKLNMPVEKESHKISMLIDDSLGETIFYQLQDAIGKLDISVRLCIRDSLFRLARNAMERHNASDRSSTNKSGKDDDEVLTNEETYSQERSTRLATETNTNPIDRTVAHLLFHRPPESRARPVEVSKQPNTCESISEEKPENVEEMEVRS